MEDQERNVEALEKMLELQTIEELREGLNNVKKVKSELVDELMRLSVLERRINEQINKRKDNGNI